MLWVFSVIVSSCQLITSRQQSASLRLGQRLGDAFQLSTNPLPVHRQSVTANKPFFFLYWEKKPSASNPMLCELSPPPTAVTGLSQDAV